MKIVITADDIAAGKKCDFHWCPVALAVSRAVGEGGTVMVSGDIIWIRGKDYPAPKLVRKFIQAFDNGEPVEPISFELKFR